MGRCYVPKIGTATGPASHRGFTSMHQNRFVARLTALAVAGLGVGAALTAAGSPAQAATGTFTQPNAVYVNDPQILRTNPTPITVPDSGPGSPYPSSVTVTSHPDTITDVNVTLRNVSHTHGTDLDVMLVGPGGQRVLLTSDAGFGNWSNLTFTLDDAAAATIPDPPINNNSYKPTNNGSPDPFPAPAPDSSLAGTLLSVFNGTSPNGTWSLYVVDDAGADIGTFAGGWTLSITTNGTSPHAASPYPSTVAASGLPSGITDVNVVLKGLTHTYPDDIDMLLVGPSGQRAMVMSDVGGSTSVSGLDVTIDAQAASLLPDDGPLVSGSFQPTNVDAGDAMPAPAPDPGTAGSALSVFNGTNPNGTWQLYVSDGAGDDDGVLSGGWSLQITTVNAPAAPAITGPASGTRDRDGAFTLTGSAPSNSTVKVYEAGVLKATTAASGIGQWSAALSGVPNGSHTFAATATDGFGNVSAPSAGVVVIVDSVKPSITSTTPAKGASSASVKANIKAKASEALRSSTVTKANAFIVVAGTSTHLKAKVSWKADSRSIVINPKVNLAHGTKYKVTITTKVLDLAGNPLDQNKTKSGLQKKTWKFTTK